MTYVLLFLSMFINSCLADIKIAVIDTGLDLSDPRFKKVLCPYGHKDFTHTTLKDTDGHGTHIAGIIKKYGGEQGYCLLILKYYTPTNKGEENLDYEIDAIRYAVAMGVSIINISGGGEVPDARERQALNTSVKVVVAAGNDGVNLDTGYPKYYPAYYALPNMYVVGNLNNLGNKYINSNYGSIVNSWEIGTNVISTYPSCNDCLDKYDNYMSLTGTSMSTAVKTGKLIKEMLKK